MIVYQDKQQGDYFIVEYIDADDGHAYGIRIGGKYDGPYDTTPVALKAYYTQVYPKVEVLDHYDVVEVRSRNGDEIWGYGVWDHREESFVDANEDGKKLVCDLFEAEKFAEFLNEKRDYERRQEEAENEYISKFAKVLKGDSCYGHCNYHF